MRHALRNARHAAGLTQAQAGRAVGCSGPAVSYYENGHRSVPLEVLHRMAAAYRCSLAALID